MNYSGKAFGKDDNFEELLHRPRPRSLFAPGHRIKMNAVPIFLNLFVPWSVYVLVGGILGFSMQYKRPTLVTILLLVVVCAWLVLVGIALWARRCDPDPTWFSYVAIVTGVAIFAGVAFGSYIYEAKSRPFYEIQDLKVISQFDPGVERGQNVLDAGVFYFVDGGHIDGDRSWHFKHKSLYCVAPIVSRSIAMATYDFWAVGKNCCSVGASDFRCGAWADTAAQSAVRLMDDKDLSYYRLAVKQAEAIHGIQSTNPIFMYWSDDPVVEVSGWSHEAFRAYCFSCGFAFVVSAFCLAIALFKYSWIGRGPPRKPELF